MASKKNAAAATTDGVKAAQVETWITDTTMKKCDVATMKAAAEALGLTITSDAPKPLAIALYESFYDAKAKGAELLRCDSCGGRSPETLDACPFCGGEEEDEKPKANAAPPSDAPKEEPKKAKAVPASDVPVTKLPPKGKAKPEKEAKPAKAPKADALAKVKPVKAEIITEPRKPTAGEVKLDTLVDEVNGAKEEGAVALWKLGAAIKTIHENEAWKQRCKEDGKTRSYTSFEQFVHVELKMSHGNAFQLIDIAANFAEADVRKFGKEKLSLLLKAPPAAVEDIKAKLEKGLLKSSRDVKGEVAKAREKDPSRRETGRKTMPKGNQDHGVKKDKVTVAMIVGRKTVALVTKATLKDEEPNSAKRLADEPCAIVELTNKVSQHFFIKQNDDGTLALVIVTKRDDA